MGNPKDKSRVVLNKERQDFRTAIQGLIYAFITLAIAMILMLVFNIWYTNHIDRQNKANWCEVLQAIDEPAPVNATKRTRDIQFKIHTLNIRLGCADDRDSG